jgi:ABC-type multidrug transport system fused ATPase/permease subunit
VSCPCSRPRSAVRLAESWNLRTMHDGTDAKSSSMMRKTQRVIVARFKKQSPHTANTMAVMTIDKSATIFMTFSAIVLGLIQKYSPPSECFFATSVCTCCLVIFAAVADTLTFFGSLFAWAPFVSRCMPERLCNHIVKSIEYLEEGERRVADMELKKGKQDKINGGDGEISTQMLLDEICKRIQWKYVFPSIITGACVQAIGYQKPKLIGQMMDNVVKEGATMESAFWPFVRQLVLFVMFDYMFISMREYYKHAATHRYNADVKTEMLTNLLDQEQDFIHSDKYSSGFVHLMDRETQRMQGIVNGSIPRLFTAIVSTCCGTYSLLRVDFRLALLGIFVNSPIMGMLQRLSVRENVKYEKLYDASNGGAARIARNILNPEVIHLLQAFVAQRRIVNSYRVKQEEFINYLEFTHFRQTLLCMFPHCLNNAQDILLLAVGLWSVIKGNQTLGSYMTFRCHLSLLDQGPKELLSFWNDIVTIRMSAAVYFELMYRESRIPCSVQSTDGQRQLENTSGGLTMSLKNVSFAYHLNPGLKVLHDVNLILKPDKIVALCGGE